MIVEVAREDFERAGEVLARAFEPTEQWRRMIPDGEIRLEKLRLMFVGTLKTARAAKGLIVATPGLEAIAVWFPPGRKMGFWPMIRSGFADVAFLVRQPRPPLRRFMSTLRQFELEHKRLMPRPHWYLMALGVDPSHQGKGYGTALVRYGLERAGTTDAPVYLETEVGPNVGFYENLGFHVLDNVRIRTIDLDFALMAPPFATPHGLSRTD